jgi:hypothetical protein
MINHLKRMIKPHLQRLLDLLNEGEKMDIEEYNRRTSATKKSSVIQQLGKKSEEVQPVVSSTAPELKTAIVEPKISKAFAILKREGTMLYFLRIYSIIGNQIVGQEDSVEDLFGMVMGRLENEVEYTHQ